MRGAILGNLALGSKFWTANIITSFLFIGLHLPGWYFANSLVGMLLKPVGGAFSIFLISLAFGYAAKRGDSARCRSTINRLTSMCWSTKCDGSCYGKRLTVMAPVDDLVISRIVFVRIIGF